MSLSSMVRVSDGAVRAGFSLSASSTMVSPSLSSVSSMTVMVAVPPSAMMMVAEESV